ncbi:hypothetical protein INR49_000135, partial [Caranx melampygus]
MMTERGFHCNLQEAADERYWLVLVRCRTAAGLRALAGHSTTLNDDSGCDIHTTTTQSAAHLLHPNPHQGVLEQSPSHPGVLLVCASLMLIVGLAILARKMWKLHKQDPMLRQVKEMKARLNGYSGDVGDSKMLLTMPTLQAFCEEKKTEEFLWRASFIPFCWTNPLIMGHLDEVEPRTGFARLRTYI